MGDSLPLTMIFESSQPCFSWWQVTELLFLQSIPNFWLWQSFFFFPWILGLIVHEGAAVYRVFKRWRAVNLHWDVLNYDKATDIEESSRGESSTSRTLWLPLTALRNRNLVHPTQLTSPRFQCGYVLLHLFNRMRPHEDLSEDNSSGEVVMRVTSVWQKRKVARCGTPCTFGNVIAMNGKTIALRKTHIYELFKIYAFYMNIWIANTFFWKKKESSCFLFPGLSHLL